MRLFDDPSLIFFGIDSSLAKVMGQTTKLKSKRKQRHPFSRHVKHHQICMVHGALKQQHELNHQRFKLIFLKNKSFIEFTKYEFVLNTHV